MTWTQEQIEEAAERALLAYAPCSRWKELSEYAKETWRAVALAAQLPIAPIADEEMYEVLQDTPYASISEQFVVAANKVIARRNAPPKSDLRGQIIEEVHGWRKGWEKKSTAESLADRIIAIVKEETK